MFSGSERAPKEASKSNVKSLKEYERFGETIRYLTLEELQLFFDSIDNYRHKLMMQVIYELGCRVGEFVRIQLKHLDFRKDEIYIPPENTKTRHRRTSHLSRGLMNEIASLLKNENRMGKRDNKIKKPDSYLFHPPNRPNRHYSENRLRQVFQHYIKKAGLDREYGADSLGRKLRQLTIHSLRHSHIMAYIHEYKLPLSIVQKQVGHRTLKATSIYLNPSDEAVGNAYQEARCSEAAQKTRVLAGPSPKDLKRRKSSSQNDTKI